jgi:hypothetical protein
MITKNKTEEFVDLFLEDAAVEDLLEYFDISVYDAFELLFAEGYIDEELIDEYLGKR